MPKKRKKPEKLAAIDFETYWSTAVSMLRMSTYQYVHHPEFNAYMVSIYCDHMEFVGQPTDFDWKRLDGYTLVAHNASFDQRVFERLQELGTIPANISVKWECTADLSVYFQYPRTLKGATKEVLGVDLSKEVRNVMKNKTWDDLVAEDVIKDVLTYALDDSKYCYELWKALGDKWPESEKNLSRMTRRMAYEGLPVSLKNLEKGLEDLKQLLFDAQKRLPWYDKTDPDTKKTYAVYSKKALALECRKRGIPPPASLDKAKPEFTEWNEKYGGKITFAADMQNVQRINKHMQTLLSMQDRLTSDYRLSFNLKYFGAAVTGRWSGGGGLNLQNLPRDPQYGVDLRRCIGAGKGKTLIVADLAQIEARLTSWLSGDSDNMALLRRGMSPYEAHARQTMGWTGGDLKKEDPDLYLLAKTRVLQLGYGCGWDKFAKTVRNFGQTHLLDRSFSRKDELHFLKFAGAFQPGRAAQYPSVSKEERRLWVNAHIQVQDFRDKNKGLKRAWDYYGSGLTAAANVGDDYITELPNGRTMGFYRCRHEIKDGERKITAAPQAGNVRRLDKLYGSLIFQNTVQACARDIFGFHLNLLDEAGYRIILHVHDEVVIEIETSRAKAALKAIVDTLSISPKWAEAVPLSADGYITKEYVK